MSKQPHIDDLISRLENAEGPDHLIDALIVGHVEGWALIEIGKDTRTDFIRWARPDGSEFMTRSHEGRDSPVDTDFDLDCYQPYPSHPVQGAPDICLCERCREREAEELERAP